ncbi:protein kinase domain-containing protein [Paractinoplanes hotanensis]|uniref:Caspase family protein n=1 Tax=Paractinoplanes hotanensis TaxID=2906497 RepID=A0ABT0Y4A1_9ACTN|nr:caspase family protein [Actinoplanes hotanensis]MCM4080863.1 caspase family protein [Actinoplanes hotanensis]
MSSKIAILVGINDYAGRWEQLTCSENDAGELAALLSMEEYGYHVRTLLNSEATKAAIMREILEARSGGFKSILFYFSGHGAATDFGTYLVTHDNADFDEGLEIRKVIELMSSGDAGQENLAIFDCCHSGTATTASRTPYILRNLLNPDVQDVLRPGAQSVAVIAACTSQQLAWEERNSGHGIFTHYLIQAMMGEAVDYEGNLTAFTAYDFISRNMATHGLYGEERQKPVFGGHLSGRLILGTGLPPALPPPLPEDMFREIEESASAFLDEYSSFKSRYNPSEWRTVGHSECSRKLESIDKWFEKRTATPGLAQRSAFQQAQETLLRFRTELGYVERGTAVPEGSLEERIGEGGFGTVWKVVDEATQQSRALKIYHPHEMYNPEKSRRFENGYDAMRMLHHPQIVGVHRYSRCPTGFTMDFIDGQNLRTLQPSSFMEPAEVLQLLWQIADAIDYAHKHDVIHRDIKPENIVCEHQADGAWKPFLTDFDLAWFSTNTQRATKTAMGVVYYAAPEQFFAFDPKAALAKTPALDVFSFGQLLFFCITGRDPDPVRLEANQELLKETSFRHGFDNKGALELGALYADATVWDHSKRLQSFTPIVTRIRNIEADLLHTKEDTPLSKTNFVAELIALLANRPVADNSTTSYVSSSGTWEISFELLDKRKGKGYHPLLKALFAPQGRIGFENTKNDQMRKTLNKRLEDAIRGMPATRRSGTWGTYQVYVDISLNKLDRNNVKKASEVITASLSALAV